MPDSFTVSGWLRSSSTPALLVLCENRSGWLWSADEEFGGVGEGGFVDAAGEHPGELPPALLALDPADACDRTPAGLLFRHDDVGGGFGRYLGEVGYRQNLVALAEFAQLRPDCRGSLAAYSGVHLVEDVGRPGLDALLGEADGEHDPGQFPARGVAAHRQLRLAGVRPDHELHPFGARWARGCGHEFRPEGRLGEV